MGRSRAGIETSGRIICSLYLEMRLLILDSDCFLCLINKGEEVHRKRRYRKGKAQINVLVTPDGKTRSFLI